ncbi:unnamed protein product [Penicillium salamii]|uniref:Uncharacterized protein n=1 Tax=Penicillium salamii TaxID=1612424 RepID=A0A9W4IZQ9_9EURO|nr:unnamed protein product [Penicillium salamii]CAG8039514.1 unnamed protein product [Penicillium salamii]CAG8052348.1 unnamed protein product [Penicillium salamii]CAG8205759.1 unnamed protein product [Penicillium salamii]CAG8322946.1 unnamed protein product [Penicillium salamii]
MNPLSFLRKWYPADSLKEDVFDPKVHLDYVPPSKKFTMKDLLLEPSTTASSIAGTVPFSLLSAEGVRAYRRALFQKEVIDNSASSPFPGTLVLRDAAKRSKFINDFWTHPKTMAIVSEAVGVPLEVIMPTEIGHTNIQVEGNTVTEMTSNLKVEPVVEKLELSAEDRGYDPLKDKNSIIPWHYDSYPYVCVLMLSETEGMIGGETYIKKGDGDAQKVRFPFIFRFQSNQLIFYIHVEGPQLGHAVMLQGGEVCHLAARAKGVKERISTITSYHSKKPGIYDSSYITNVRPYADIDSLYPEWAEYRLRKLRDELTYFLDEENKKDDPVRERKEIHNLIEQQIEYLQRTSRQMVSPEHTKHSVEKYGKPAYYDSPKIWKALQSLPDFEIIASAADSKRQWMPESPYWMDLQRSIETIKLGNPLQSALGTAVLDKKRAYCMGDELLRQGLNELFLDWLDDSGLLELYNQLI